MHHFASYDGTKLAYHERGRGAPLVCVPGGPGRASAYLADLGGLSAYRRLVLLDNRGTGDSAVPEDPDTYRCERLVDDVEALRTLRARPMDRRPGRVRGNRQCLLGYDAVLTGDPPG